jgi:hypothetical protein
MGWCLEAIHWGASLWQNARGWSPSEARLITAIHARASWTSSEPCGNVIPGTMTVRMPRDAKKAPKLSWTKLEGEVEQAP